MPKQILRTLGAALTVLASAALGPDSVAAQALIGGDWRGDVEAYATRLIDAGLAPGFGVAVTSGDRVVFEAGFGSADLASQREVTLATPFYIASTTKSLTALAAVLAAERGELDLDAPMVRYLPDAVLPEGVERESIRVEDLITLTHGLSGDGPVVLRTAYTGEFTRDELMELVRYHAPTGNRGRFEYNNLGFNLLGMVLESIFDASWKEVVAREVTRPLGMTRTHADVSAYGPDETAMPHAVDPAGGFTRVSLQKDDSNMHAAGGHFATAGDLARYLAAHLTGGIVAGRPALPSAPIRATHVLRAEQDRQFGPYHRHGWGYGWDLGTLRGDTLIHRFGGFPGYRSHVSFMPKRDLGVVVLTNGDGPASAASDLLATFIYDRLAGGGDIRATYEAGLAEAEEQAGAARAGLAAHLAERRARMAPLPHPLQDYAGTFENALLGRITFLKIGSALEFRAGEARSQVEVFDAAANRLRVEIGGSGTVVTFRLPDEDGLAAAVELSGQVFTRVPDPA